MVRSVRQVCPGCKIKIKGPIDTALSRYGHGNLCSKCGTREAVEGDFIGKEEVTK